MTHDSAGQAGAHQDGEIEITEKMISDGAWALLDWIGDGKTEQTQLASCEHGLTSILQAVFGDRAKFSE